MMNRNLMTNNSIIAFMFSCLIFGFLAVGVASAESTTKPTNTETHHLATGFTDRDYAIEGGWLIEKRRNSHVIKFTSEFSTKAGPDLKVFLSPRAFESVRGSNATHESVLLGKLKNNTGEQEYLLPEGIDLNDYQSLLIHCEAFSVLWGGANIVDGAHQ